MLDNEYVRDDHKSTRLPILARIKYLNMLKFIADHLKTKRMSKHPVKKLPLKRYVPDQYRTQQVL